MSKTICSALLSKDKFHFFIFSFFLIRSISLFLFKVFSILTLYIKTRKKQLLSVGAHLISIYGGKKLLLCFIVCFPLSYIVVGFIFFVSFFLELLNVWYKKDASVETWRGNWVKLKFKNPVIYYFGDSSIRSMFCLVCDTVLDSHFFGLNPTFVFLEIMWSTPALSTLNYVHGHSMQFIEISFNLCWFGHRHNARMVMFSPFSVHRMQFFSIYGSHYVPFLLNWPNPMLYTTAIINIWNIIALRTLQYILLCHAHFFPDNKKNSYENCWSNQNEIRN